VPYRRQRILIYSHDTFGLGHLRRCRAIAAALTRAHPAVSVLILSGSPVIGAFSFPERVDFVRLPGVLKLEDGGYRAQTLDMHLDDVIAVRAALIETAVGAFAPDLVIVDKEPLGLRGEFGPGLRQAKRAGAKLVLGLRDVLDDAEALAAEWQRKKVGPALASLYDEIWIYGVEELYDPLKGLTLAEGIANKTVFTGYLRREALPPTVAPRAYALPEQPFVLVTTGGGGDGGGLIDWALSAYEAGHDLPRALMVLGPFMDPAARAGFLDRASRFSGVTAVTFDAELERAIEAASGVIAMGGYNTFCEIVSFDKPAVIVPRERPRREQWIRAKRAGDRGLVRLLEDPCEQGRPRDPAAMAAAIAGVVGQQRPSHAAPPGFLDGLTLVSARAAALTGAAA
jgi:predicted glycosyltransferase